MGWPKPTIRLRLTALYGAVFLVTGAVLLTLGYLLVRHNLDARPNFGVVRQKLQTLGVPPPDAAVPRGIFDFLPGSPARQVAVAVHAQLRTSALHRLLLEYLLALGAMTLISAASGWLLAGRALSPLRRIIATARRVSAENLGERIGLTGPADELRELADTFDSMLARLESTFDSQRHFVANASHELRTPLAIMRTEIDVALAERHARAGDLRHMGEAVRETVDRCERLIEGLLTLARSEATAGRGERVDLAALAGDCVTDLHARAQEADVSVHAELAPAWTRGEPTLLERMIANLIDNGIRYNRPGGFLDIRTAVQGTKVQVLVSNAGAVVSEHELGRLAEPFERLERSQGGFGLGLSIVCSVVKAHGGVIGFTARPSGGLEVRLELPLEPEGPQIRAGKESAALTPS